MGMNINENFVDAEAPATLKPYLEHGNALNRKKA
jgi:hypothetical protein